MRFKSDRQSVNRASFAGRWYPAAPDRLRQQLETFVQSVRNEYQGTAEDAPQGAVEAPPQGATEAHSAGHSAAKGAIPWPADNGGRPLAGAILPHAGLSYSGAGMAEAFARLEPDAVDHVLLLSPSHYYRLDPDTLYVEAFTEHETPLGPIPGVPGFWGLAGDPASGDDDTVAAGTGSRIAARDIENAEEAIEGEHGTELFFPFIRHTLGPSAALSVALVPELTSLDAISRLADTIDARVAAAKGWNRTLLLMSSDFTHYGPAFRHTPYGSAETVGIEELETRVAADDTAVAGSAAECDVEGLFERFQGERTTVCGRYPILLGTELLRRRNSNGRVARYYNSNGFGRRSGEFVCYAAVLFGRERDA